MTVCFSVAVFGSEFWFVIEKPGFVICMKKQKLKVFTQFIIYRRAMIEGVHFSLCIPFPWRELSSFTFETETFEFLAWNEWINEMVVLCKRNDFYHMHELEIKKEVWAEW